MCSRATISQAPTGRIPGPHGPDPQLGEGLADVLPGKVPRSVGQLVEPGQQAPFGPAADEEAVPASHGEHGQILLPLGLLLPPVGKSVPGAVLGRPAQGRKGAAVAQGGLGQADEGPQVHERLVQIPGPAAHPVPEKARPPVPDRLAGHVRPVLKEPGQDPEHVPVHGGLRFTEGDGGDGSGGVGPHAGELFQFFRAIRKPAPVFVHHGQGALFQIPGPGIVAEALPQLQQPLLVAGGQGLHRGQFVHEPAVIGDHRRRPGLLEHDLRHQYGIGVPCSPPGEGPFVAVVPRHQGRCKFHESSIPHPGGMCYTVAITR